MTVTIKKFEADWCHPCSQQDELLEAFDAAPVEHIDVDEEQQTAMDYGIKSLPTLVVEEDGETVQVFTGVTQPDTLAEAVEGLK